MSYVTIWNARKYEYSTFLMHTSANSLTHTLTFWNIQRVSRLENVPGGPVTRPNMKNKDMLAGIMYVKEYAEFIGEPK